MVSTWLDPHGVRLNGFGRLKTRVDVILVIPMRFVLFWGFRSLRKGGQKVWTVATLLANG
jgi:hypothetical protein